MSGAAATVAREALLPALALVTRAVERRNTIPVLQNVLLRGASERLNLVATDLDVELSTSCASAVTAPFETTLPAANLHDIVRKLPEGCQVTLAGEEQAWAISGSRSKFRLHCLPASDFPEMQGGEFSHSFSLAGSTLAAMIGAVRFAISSEETRYYLNGIYLHDEENSDGARIVAVATDGHRLAKFLMDRPDEAAGMPSIILPRRTVDLMSKLLPEKGDVTVSLSETKVRFELEDGTALVSKLIEGTYPDYRRVVPASNANRFMIGRQELHAAVDRVTTISSARGSAVRFAFADGELTLSAANPDAGSAEESLPVEMVAGEPVEIGFNGRYCLDMLTAATAERVEFSLGDAGAPALVQPVSADDGPTDRQLFVLMPMRV